MVFFNIFAGSMVSEPVNEKYLDEVRNKIREVNIPDGTATDIWHLISVGTDVTVNGCVAEYGNVQLPFLVVPVRTYPGTTGNHVKYFVVYRNQVVETGTCSPTKVSTYRKFSQFIRENFCSKYGQMPDHTAKTLWDLFGWLGDIL